MIFSREEFGSEIVLETRVQAAPGDDLLVGESGKFSVMSAAALLSGATFDLNGHTATRKHLWKPKINEPGKWLRTPCATAVGN